MNPNIKLVIVCGPDLSYEHALEYSKDRGFLGSQTDFYSFPEANFGYAAYRELVSDVIEDVVNTDMIVLIHTRYLEPAISGFVEVTRDSYYKKRAIVVDHDQVEVHLYRSENGWSVHHLDSELHLDNEWPVGIFY
jgi:hypothetical protein